MAGDFLEILSICGYDLDAAEEMAREHPRYTPELLEQIMEDSCVDRIQSQPDRKIGR